MRSFVDDSYLTKFGEIAKGDVLLVEDSYSKVFVLRINGFRSALFGGDKEITMVDYAVIHPTLYYAPLTPLNQFEKNLSSVKILFEIEEKDWERFCEFLRIWQKLEKMRAEFDALSKLAGR